MYCPNFSSYEICRWPANTHLRPRQGFDHSRPAYRASCCWPSTACRSSTFTPLHRILHFLHGTARFPLERRNLLVRMQHRCLWHCTGSRLLSDLCNYSFWKVTRTSPQSLPTHYAINLLLPLSSHLRVRRVAWEPITLFKRTTAASRDKPNTSTIQRIWGKPGHYFDSRGLNQQPFSLRGSNDLEVNSCVVVSLENVPYANVEGIEWTGRYVTD